jgi:hypothetical protein
MNGRNVITFTHLNDEDYIVTMPNFYARGVLFGKMYIEIGDQVCVSCPKNDLICEIDFKIKVKQSVFIKFSNTVVCLIY